MKEHQSWKREITMRKRAVMTGKRVFAIAPVISAPKKVTCRLQRQASLAIIGLLQRSVSSQATEYAARMILNIAVHGQ